MKILGLSCYYHDAAACLVVDGKVVAAASEERFTRIKQDAEFPIHAIRYCLEEGGITESELDFVAFYDKPFLKFERILETYIATAPAGLRSFLEAIPLWIKKKLFIPKMIQDELVGFGGQMLFPEHHESHAASAFFPSPYPEAAFLTIDGVGEWATTSWGVGKENQVEIHQEIHFPHSLGLLYSAFTYYTGFRVNSGEYKVMGLAPYGEPKYVDQIYEHLIDVKDDGSFRMDMSYFDYVSGLRMTGPKFHRLFGGPPREPESELTQREMDLARSVQVVCEEVMLKMAEHIRQVTGQKYLCLAGGVALNCVGNGRILRESGYDDIWIQPAAGDAGGSLGAALVAWHHYLDEPRQARPRGTTEGSYYGPGFSDDAIREVLDGFGAVYERIGLDALPETVAQLIADQNVIGWFQGRMEFGPRALGSRSIIGDARSAKMQSVMNLKIKYRESFRPFAPSVMYDQVSEWFQLDRESPYMLLVAPVDEEKWLEMTEEQKQLFGIEKLNIPRSEIPAVTHVDYSARVQTVHPDDNPLYYAMIRGFYEKTGCPVIINTSFNVRGEPIVCDPKHAYICFMRTEMDYLACGPYLLDKRAQPEFRESGNWRDEFELD
ncbi:MAG: carbamoyltransferase [Holophagales bacterium]|nr:carbamoyltransferase [Holophagales bacterium]